MMKKILLLLLLLTCLTCTGQEKVNIDTLIYPYIEEFIVEASNRNIDVIDVIISLDNIKIDNELPYLGLFQNNSIYVNPLIFEDRLMTKAVITHELFHALGIPDCHPKGFDLMCASKPLGFTYGYYLDDNTWSKILDYNFDKLK